MKFVYANENHSTMINEKNGVVFLTFPKLVKAGVCHGFSTRIGGVSEGYLSSMNLSFTRGDDPQKYRRIFKESEKQLVLMQQIWCCLLRFMRPGFVKLQQRIRGWHCERNCVGN